MRPARPGDCSGCDRDEGGAAAAVHDPDVPADGTVNATCGTGCWGTFDEFLPYSVPRAGWGTLQVYVLSAQDGSVENLTEYPVWLTP